MSRDEILSLAREVWDKPNWNEAQMERLERFAALVAAAEREACAKVCEDDVRTWSHPGSITREECAAAIRARKENA